MARSKVVGRIGDVNPTEHGGGSVLRHPQGHAYLVYTPGPSDDDEDAKKLEVYVVQLPASYAELKSDLSWVDFKKVFDSLGMSHEDAAQYVGEARTARGDAAAMRYARFFEDVAGYYGWHELDNYPTKRPIKEVEKLLRGG